MAEVNAYPASRTTRSFLTRLHHRILESPATTTGAGNAPQAMAQPLPTSFLSSNQDDFAEGTNKMSRAFNWKPKLKVLCIKKATVGEVSPSPAELVESGGGPDNMASISSLDGNAVTSAGSNTNTTRPGAKSNWIFNRGNDATKSRNDLKLNLSHIKSALAILAGVGDILAPVPGLKGVAGIMLEIVRIVEVAQSNKKAANTIVIRAFGLVHIISDPSLVAFDNEGNAPLFIREFETALTEISNTIKSVVLQDIRWYNKILTCEAVKDKIMDCNNLLDGHVERFQVEIGLANRQALERHRTESSGQKGSYFTTIVSTLQEHNDGLRQEIKMTALKINEAVSFFFF